MAKNIPTNEFKTAIKDLNVLLKSVKVEPIKFVGVKKDQALKNFTKVDERYENLYQSKRHEDTIYFWHDLKFL